MQTGSFDLSTYRNCFFFQQRTMQQLPLFICNLQRFFRTLVIREKRGTRGRGIRIRIVWRGPRVWRKSTVRASRLCPRCCRHLGLAWLVVAARATICRSRSFAPLSHWSRTSFGTGCQGFRYLGDRLQVRFDGIGASRLMNNYSLLFV